MRENTVIWSMVPRRLFYCISFLDLPSKVKKGLIFQKRVFLYPQSFSLPFLDPSLVLQYIFEIGKTAAKIVQSLYWIQSATCKTVKDEVLRIQFCTESCFWIINIDAPETFQSDLLDTMSWYLMQVVHQTCKFFLHMSISSCIILNPASIPGLQLPENYIHSEVL